MNDAEMKLIEQYAWLIPKLPRGRQIMKKIFIIMCTVILPISMLCGFAAAESNTTNEKPPALAATQSMVTDDSATESDVINEVDKEDERYSGEDSRIFDKSLNNTSPTFTNLDKIFTADDMVSFEGDAVEGVNQFRKNGFGEIGFGPTDDNIIVGTKNDIIYMSFDIPDIHWTLFAEKANSIKPKDVIYPETATLMNEYDITAFNGAIGHLLQYIWFVDMDEYTHFNTAYAVYFPETQNLYCIYTNELIMSETEYNEIQSPEALFTMTWSDNRIYSADWQNNRQPSKAQPVP